MPKVTLLCLSLTSLLVAKVLPAADGQSSPPTPREVALATHARPAAALQQDSARRLAQAAPVRMVAPLWQLGPTLSSDLYVINTFSEALDAKASVLDPAGRVVGTAYLTVEPARHRVLSLGSVIGSSGGAPSEGSLRLEYVGDKDMLQAWVVRREAGAVTEVPLKKVSADTERRLTSFWDLRRSPSRGGDEVRFWMVNGGTGPLPFRIEAGDEGRLGRVLTSGVLQPGEQRPWEPRGSGISPAHGVVSFVHDGAPGSLAVAGLVQGRNVLASLPMVTPEARLLSPEYHSVRVPFFSVVRAGHGEATLTLANTADRAQTVAVQVVNARGGEVLLGEEDVEMRPGEVRAVDVGAFLKSHVLPAAEDARLMVRGELSGLLVGGLARSYLTGETTEFALFSREHGHPNGSYPIPDPSRFEVWTTLVNLGEEESRIVGQVSWDGGTFSIGPVVVPGRASHTVDFRRLAAQGDEDLADRTLPESFSGGFLHWTVQGGSTDFIARTEVAPRGGSDTFGFNCFGCCSERSRGAVLPSSTTFAAGSGAPFEGVEFIDTCSGTMGPFSPYGASWSSQWPFSWNGTTVSASAPGSQDLSFSATGHKIRVQFPCSEVPITIYGLGPATATKVTILDVSLPNNRVRVRLEPAGMSGTLEVKLTGASQRVLVNTTYSSGDHTINFGNLSSYTAGQQFSQVTAKWTVSGTAATATYNYAVKVLGNYNHTRYNTPVSNINCSGNPTTFCYRSGDCTIVQCTSHTSATAPFAWVFEVEENGSGKHAQLGYFSREGICGFPSGCAYNFRRVNVPCPKCTGRAVIPNQTVAIHANNPDLSCGSRVFVEGVGEVTVTDHGDLALKQLDHYAGDSGCNDPPSIGQRMTFLLQ